MTTRKEQLGITGGKMHRGEEINPSTDRPRFLDTNKATETGPKKGTVSGKKPESKMEDEAAHFRQYIVDIVSKVAAGVTDPSEICRQMNEAAKTSPARGDLRLKAEYDPAIEAFYFNFLNAEGKLSFYIGPVPAQEVLKLIPK